ncbi:MAG: hypothetical protein QOH68_1211 [Nocardioidaceae bacterium]|jgi:hypothetical protein|nr:hypothetical protein [Nocardioidaceae bacterium]
MPTLHIEHAISDFDVWTAAFGRFEEIRQNAGVRDQRVHRPVDDEHYVVVDLDFDTAEEAAAMLELLRTKVWASPAASPALVGRPNARVLEPVEI